MGNRMYSALLTKKATALFKKGRVYVYTVCRLAEWGREGQTKGWLQQLLRRLTRLEAEAEAKAGGFHG